MLVLAGCGGATTEPHGYTDVEAALRSAGLEICAVTTPERTVENTLGERWLTVSPSCEEEPDEDTVLVVTEWPDVDARDHALRRFEGQYRPSAQRHGVTWGIGLLTIHVSGTRDGEVLDRVADALRELGAS